MGETEIEEELGDGSLVSRGGQGSRESFGVSPNSGLLSFSISLDSLRLVPFVPAFWLITVEENVYV